jgi:sugar phosphate isomerase/epimerase
MNRKEFLKAGTASAVACLGSSCRTIAGEKKGIALGFDNFSIRAFGWKAGHVLEYAAKQRVDTVLFSDLDVYENHDASYLGEVKAQATELGIRLQAGTGSICGSAANFKDKHGTDVEHLALTLRVANQIGADVARCYMGSSRDRKSKGGLGPHMDRTVAVCKAVEAQAEDLGVKIAIENHSGDMTAWQLKTLIERAGADYVGATIDAGNAAFTLEDPIENLKILGPYVLSSGIRDTAVWNSDKGIGVWWKAMGEGNVDWQRYFQLWRQLCPSAPVQLEIISQWGKTIPPKSDAKFWKHYQDIRDADYQAFTKLAAAGTAPPPAPKERFDKEFMQQDLETSLRYCREIHGLGIQA